MWFRVAGFGGFCCRVSKVLLKGQVRCVDCSAWGLGLSLLKGVGIFRFVYTYSRC